MSKKVVVMGGGVLGSQIAMQSIFHGFDTTIWLRSEGSIERATPKLDRFMNIYVKELEDLKAHIGEEVDFPRGLINDFSEMTVEKLDDLIAKFKEAYANKTMTTDLAEAAKDAYLMIESVSENPQQKIELFDKLSEVLEDKTIVVTNSSSMVPSLFRDHVKHNERFLALHFANNIWRRNTGEVMGHSETSPAAFEEVAKFAEEIGMIPLRIKKEVPGYLLNSLLIPFLDAAQTLLAFDIAEPQDIDKAWKLGTGAPHGPVEILDVVGLETPYQIVMNKPDVNEEGSASNRIAKMLKSYIDQGKTGINAGEGFYKYK